MSELHNKKAVSDFAFIWSFCPAAAMPNSRDAAAKTIFSQIMEWIHPEQFCRYVQRHCGNYRRRQTLGVFPAKPGGIPDDSLIGVAWQTSKSAGGRAPTNSIG
jgi:hypothetical protein